MRYLEAIKLMDSAVMDYKSAIDELARDYRNRTDAANRELDRVAEDLTPAGQAKFRESRMPKSAEYTKQIRDAQERARTIINHGIERLTAALDVFFATPPGSTFVEYITAIAVTGMEPTNREFGLLRKAARTYSELRLLQNLGDHRTRTEQRVELTDPATATTTTKAVQIEHPFKISLPDPDAAYGALKSFENAALGAVRFYSGENLELAAMLPDLVNGDEAVVMSGLATAYFRNHGAERLTEAMEKIDDVFVRRQLKTTLTESDKRLIRAIAPDEEATKYPYMVNEKVRNICMADETMRQIFALDPRFAEIARKAVEAE